jgi:hypothetical protein
MNINGPAAMPSMVPPSLSMPMSMPLPLPPPLQSVAGANPPGGGGGGPPIKSYSDFMRSLAAKYNNNEYENQTLALAMQIN